MTIHLKISGNIFLHI